MFGIIIATHGQMSEGLKDAADVIVGMVDGIKTHSLVKGANVENLGQDLMTSIKEADEGEGVIIFTDLVSASPYNQSMIAINQLKDDHNVHVIAGVSLPMLLEAINHQLINTSIEEAVPLIVDQGTNGVGHWHISMLDNDDSDDFDDDF